ncbi:MAG TPA: DUF6328 family protein [Acidimicrobiales bacterium]|jgi:hypothetical protein|nr:DUF6328 family protein [Acidimicrobiales bacterium]
MDSGGAKPADDGRHESEDERIDRNVAELLQELRVASLGIQVLFGFLLSLPFTNHFSRLDHPQRILYQASLLLAVGATALLTAPVAYHRIVFRQRAKARLLAASNVLALAGLTTVGLALSAAVWLVVSTVDSGAVVPVLAAIMPVIFIALWFVLPMVGRRRGSAR